MTNRPVLLFAFDYPPCSGGVARLCSAIREGLQREGVDVRLLTQGTGPETSNTSSEKEVRIRNRRPGRELDAFRWIRRNFRKQPAICAMWYPEGLIALLAGARPVVILAHGAELLPPVEGWRRPLWKFLQRSVLHRARLVIANSQFTGRMVREAAPKASLQVQRPAIDHTRFVPSDTAEAKRRYEVAGKTVLCTVSRIHDFKGHETVLRAIARLGACERAGLVYLVAGRGPDEHRLRALASELGVDSSLRWLGFVPENELPELYQAADLFVLCTRKAARSVEGFGLVFLEAQASGVPVIGTRTGGIPEAVEEGAGGWLIDVDDPEVLAGIIHEVLAHPERAREAGCAGRNRILREFTWEIYSSELSGKLREIGAIS